MENIVYRKDVSRAQIVMDEPEGSAGSWELDMLLFNEPDRLLPVSECCEGEIRRCYYDVTGASALSAVMIRGRFDTEMIRTLMSDLCAALEQTADYLLDGGRLLLDPEYIYYRKEHCQFCYRPFAPSDFDREFEKLASFISEHTGAEDPGAVRMAGRLYRLALEKSADLTSIREAMHELEEDSSCEICRDDEDDVCGPEEPGNQFDDEPALSAGSGFEGGWTEEDLGDIDQLFAGGPPQFTVVEPEKKKRRRKKQAASVWGDWSQFNLENP